MEEQSLIDLEAEKRRFEDGGILVLVNEDENKLEFLVKDGKTTLVHMITQKNITMRSPYWIDIVPFGVYRLDFDKNGYQDFLIFYRYSGVSLPSYDNTVEIYLKKDDGSYQKISYDTLSAGLEDYVDINKDGMIEVIIADILTLQKDNYLSYDVYEFSDYALVNADGKFRRFPKFVKITDRPNCLLYTSPSPRD